MPMRKRVDAVLVASLVLTDDEVAALTALGMPGRAARPRPRPGSCPPASTTSRRRADGGRAPARARAPAHRLIGGDTDDPMRFTPPLHRARRLPRRAGRGRRRRPTRRWRCSATSPSTAAARPASSCWRCPSRPTAIFAESDEMAYGALRAMRRRRAAGARGRRGDRLRRPRHRRADGPVDDPPAGRRAGAGRHDPAAGRDRPTPDRATATDVVLPTELVVRGSTDATQSTSRSY